MWMLNKAENSFVVNFSSACKRPGKSTKNPIDAFYASFDRCIKLAGTAPFSSDEQLRSLLFVPIFAAAELYFRSFIGGMVELCPFARQKASTQLVTIGALQSLGVARVAVAIAEHEGLTSKGQIANRTRNILGFDINGNSSLAQAVKDFESVCHLRHAIVHLNGELLYLNRRELGITASGRLQLRTELQTLQDVLGKVANVIRSYNAHVGTEVGRRWLDEGRLTGRWKSDRQKFEPYIRFVASKHDLTPMPPAVDHYKNLLALHPPAQRRSRFVP